MTNQRLEMQYEEILQSFLQKKGEDQLYLAQQFSKWLLRQNVSPEEIIDYHLRALEKHVAISEQVRHSFQLLTEVMIEYGIAFRQHRLLRYKQQQIESEIEVAVTMQQSLLPHVYPDSAAVDIGVISIPAKQMSGDYYNFVKLDETSFSVAIADIVGKGIPAALCMSMIKYGMDLRAESRLSPAEMLRHLNSLVEKNIDPSMFITMLFGIYDTNTHIFRYSVAGHEPGFLYRSRENKLFDLQGRGLVLGVSRDVTYSELEVRLEPGDMVLLVTDGVTERKIDQQFLQRERLASLIMEDIHLSAQGMVDSIYRKLLYMSNFELPDDYTMIVLHRTQ